MVGHVFIFTFVYVQVHMFKFSDDFHPPASAGPVGLLRNADQHKAKCQRVAQLLEDHHEGDDLPPPAELALRQLLEKHYNVGALRWLACHARTPSCRDPRAPKTALVTELIKAAVLPPPIAALNHAISAWKRRVADGNAGAGSGNGAPAEGAREGAAGGSGADDDSDEGDEGDVVCAAPGCGELGEVELCSDCGAWACDAHSDHAHSCPPGRLAGGARVNVRAGDFAAVTQQLSDIASLLRTQAKQGKKADDTSDDDGGADASKFDRWIAKAKKDFASHAFVDPMRCCPRVLDKLRFAVSGMRRTTNVGGIRISLQDDVISSVGGWWDADQMRAGYNYMLELMLQVPEARHRVPDLMAFGRKVWEFPGATSFGKAVYLKQMLFKYRACDDFVARFYHDSEMERKFLHGSDSPGLRELAPRAARAGQAQRGGARRDGVRRDGTRKRGAPPRSDKVCWTRLEKGRGECTFNNCRFNHSCASCGGDHSADKCNRWDAAKAKRASDSQRSALRRRT